MPIAKFRHLHWGSKPDEQEKVSLLNWIREARKMSLPKETPNVDADRLVQPIPDSIETDKAKVALGHDLTLMDVYQAMVLFNVILVTN